MDIVGGIAAAKGAIDIASALRNAERSLDAASYKAQLADLMEKLTDVRLALVEAKELIGERDDEIERLKASFEERAELIKGDGDYSYRVNEKGERSGFPVCPKCQAIHQRQIQLKQHDRIDAAKCPACDAEFHPVTSYIPASENGGTETTAMDRYYEQERARRSKQYAAIARANSGSSWMA